ncbi:tetrathionate reductase subunit TtrC [Salmonella enterica subsp. enterica]|nr:tetrathionate reductase subunit TtrC [Salmonella sp. SSDFZ54]ECC2822909.1 tetrathionate reductase subunit TtrC [Salmonella enterica subsp. enterica]EEJ0113402.1 tetrathionate reductase subunit TtrC [Salmonella enterica subsp. enterica]HCR9497901.1 tetrathionate reductase subunit TtrC [Salmonella enterica subsp. enterica serovar Senftenberg]
MTHSLIIEEVLAHPQDISWLPWAVQYFFFIGIAACAALFACYLHWRKKDAATEENRALLIAITCAITAPLALTADLHQTARVWHFYAWPTPWSWMPWGALFLPLFTGFLALWFLAQQIKRLFNKSYNVTKWLALASALCAVGLLIYTGREVSVVLARPIWFSYAFPVAMFLSALQAFFALMEAFCIAVAKRLHLPGFGDRAITDPQGNAFPLNRAEDFYLRVAANIAFMGKTPVAPANQEDISLTGVSRILPAIQHTLKADEVGRVAFIYSRGGRFAPEDSGYTEQRLGNAWKKPLQIWNADVAAHRHAITGERFSGCPVWYPARLSDGRAIDDQFPIGQWPLKLISFKSNTMSSSTAVIPRLHHVKPANLVALNPQDGERYGLQHGDRVRIITPGGQVVAQISLLNGVMPGVIAIEHGYGHREMGATQHSLDGVPMPYDPQIRAGINLNDLGFADPTRTITNTWLDWVSGAAVRQGLPAKIERI